MMSKICVILPCSAALTDPSFWYSTWHILSVGEYSNTRNPNEREPTRRGIIISHAMYTLDCTNAHKCKLAYKQCVANPARSAQVFWQVTRICRSTHAGARPILLLLPYKTCCTAFHDNSLSFTTTAPPSQINHSNSQPKHLSCISCCRKSSCQDNFRLQQKYSKFRARPG